MILRWRRPPSLSRVLLTPDEAHAEALRRKQESLQYTPENGFHRDRRQARVQQPIRSTRWLQSA
jgi:hypothetical protein